MAVSLITAESAGMCGPAVCSNYADAFVRRAVCAVRVRLFKRSFSSVTLGYRFFSALDSGKAAHTPSAGLFAELRAAAFNQTVVAAHPVGQQPVSRLVLSLSVHCR